MLPDESVPRLIVKAIGDAMTLWQKVKEEEATLYEKRTQVMERMAMALEHDNEKKWHSVR